MCTTAIKDLTLDYKSFGTWSKQLWNYSKTVTMFEHKFLLHFSSFSFVLPFFKVREMSICVRKHWVIHVSDLYTLYILQTFNPQTRGEFACAAYEKT